MAIFVNTDEDKNEVEIISDTIKCQKKVKQSLFELMNRKREPIIPEVDLRNSRWCRYLESEFIEPSDVNKFKNLIYKLHRALDLHEKDDAREIMLNHLDELGKKAAMKVKEVPYEEIECKLCGSKISGILHLRSHISSSYHCIKEKALRDQQDL